MILSFKRDLGGNTCICHNLVYFLDGAKHQITVIFGYNPFFQMIVLVDNKFLFLLPLVNKCK